MGKFRHFIGDAHSFQLLPLYTSYLQNKTQIKSSFYALLFGKVMFKNYFPYVRSSIFPVFSYWWGT